MILIAAFRIYFVEREANVQTLNRVWCGRWQSRQPWKQSKPYRTESSV
jgi:hypothetical protein